MGLIFDCLAQSFGAADCRSNSNPFRQVLHGSGVIATGIFLCQYNSIAWHDFLRKKEATGTSGFTGVFLLES